MQVWLIHYLIDYEGLTETKVYSSRSKLEEGFIKHVNDTRPSRAVEVLTFEEAEKAFRRRRKNESYDIETCEVDGDVDDPMAG